MVIVPFFLSLKYCSTALIVLTVPKKLILNTSSICSTSISLSFLGFQVPVEKKQISISWYLFLICSKTSAHFCLSVTSNGKAEIFSYWLDNSFNNSSLLAETTTFQPLFANLIAKALPIPVLPPVIQIVFLFIIFCIYS